MRIAILGYGVVGGGVHALLRDGSLGMTVGRVLDRRVLPELGPLRTAEIRDILEDRSIDAVVEAIGGLHPALDFVHAALCAGKHVVTSNKEMVSHAYAELTNLASAHGVQLRFSASVGGGIPWLHNLLRTARGDRIRALRGIVNGTTNYILDAMGGGVDFGDALARAQALGFAEADPTADLEGLDAQRKCAISASLAFGGAVAPDRVPALGIAAIRKADIEAFAARGLACRLMACAGAVAAGVYAYVEPTLVDAGSLEAQVKTNHNCIFLTAEALGDAAFYGQGAGRFPTAQNVVQDLLDIRDGLPASVPGTAPIPVRNGAISHRYYIRTRLPLPEGLAREAWGEGVATNPMSVAEAHALASRIRAEDAGAFFAGMGGGKQP